MVGWLIIFSLTVCAQPGAWGSTILVPIYSPYLWFSLIRFLKASL